MGPLTPQHTIRDLNDAFRRTLQGGSLVFTCGVIALGEDAHLSILEALAAFDDFDADNDPHGEHDFGELVIEGQRLFFKFDYYDLDLQAHSPDPANPAVTKRVLTIMLAEEY